MRDFLEYFDREYGPKLGARTPTFRAVIREAIHMKVKSVVETGTMRKLGNWEGDGQSTIILENYMSSVHGSFMSIDIDQEAIELAKKSLILGRCICQDSVAWLSANKNEIDLLYLDSFDLDRSEPHPAALHCMFEFCAARPQLHPGSIVFIDDSPATADGEITGKGAYVAQYLKQLGIRPFTFGWQAAWLMP